MGILATNFEFLFFYQLNIINLALTDWLVSQYIIVFWMFDWRGSNTKAHSIFYCKGHFYWPAALKMWTSIDPRSRIDGEDNCIFKFCKFCSMVIEKIFVSTRHTSLKNAQFAIKWNVYSHLDCWFKHIWDLESHWHQLSQDTINLSTSWQNSREYSLKVNNQIFETFLGNFGNYHKNSSNVYSSLKMFEERRRENESLM